MHGIMATIAEFYSQNLSAEAKKGMTQKAKMGGTPGKAPIGYTNTRIQVEGREVRTVVIDEKRAPFVRWAFETFASGDWTVSSMTEALEEKGLRCKPTRKLPSKPLSRTRVHQMLRHPYYMGIVRWDGVHHPGRHQPLISRETWEAVQSVLDLRSSGKERPMKRTHYLKGMLRCGRCGSRLGVSLNKSHTGEPYPYFFCLGRQRKNGCLLRYLPVEIVELEVAKYWRRVRITG